MLIIFFIPIHGGNKNSDLGGAVFRSKTLILSLTTVFTLTRYISRSRSRSPRSRRPSSPDPPPAPEVNRRPPPNSPEKIRRPPKSPEKRRPPPPTSEGKGPPTATAAEAPSKDDLEAEYRKYKERTEARIRREKEKLQRYESRIKQLTHLADGTSIYGHVSKQYIWS